ncbi:MAG TPA: glycosyltransferase [Thermosynechococcaceae cyanobacterium]
MPIYPVSPLLPTISIIIPVYNGGENFRRCLSSLEKINAEVIVVADGDTDGSWQIAQQFGAKVLRRLTAGGPALARNLGARSAQGEILFFMDADVMIAPDTLPQVQSIFEQDPSLGALIGSYDDAPGATNFLSQYRNLFHHYTHQTGNSEASTFWGACGAIRREVFLRVGGFDEAYRKPSIEDIELGYRLKQLGYRIRLCKTVQVKHLKHWGVVSMLRADFFYRALPWTELICRDHHLINDLNLKTSSRVSVVLVYALVLLLSVAPWWSVAWLLAVSVGVFLLVMNFSVYRFFLRKRGFWFAVRTIPWHWLYFFYSGLAFAIGNVRYRLGYRSQPASTV